MKYFALVCQFMHPNRSCLHRQKCENPQKIKNGFPGSFRHDDDAEKGRGSRRVLY